MSRTLLKETFIEPAITSNFMFEEGLIDESIGSIVKQIVNNQLKKFVNKGKLALSKPSLDILKKLNKLGVKKFAGYDLNKAIPALEQELSDNQNSDERDVLGVLRGLSSNNFQSTRTRRKRYPIKKGGRIVGWRTHKESVYRAQYSLSKLFAE